MIGYKYIIILLQALSVGIFPYVLKLLQSSARELRPLLVFIWAKILAVDSVSHVLFTPVVFYVLLIFVPCSGQVALQQMCLFPENYNCITNYRNCQLHSLSVPLIGTTYLFVHFQK